MNLNKAELLKRFSNVTVWKKGDKRAPHKPLLILYMPGSCPTKSFMRNRDVRGRFPIEIEKQLSSDPELLR